MVKITDLSPDILFYLISGHLNAQDFSNLTQCSRYFYQLQSIDIIWKRFCLQDFYLNYNHPNQTFRDLYFQCTDKSKRLPCCHLSSIRPLDAISPDIATNLKNRDQCETCFVKGNENLFICVSNQCHKILCDRHARHHTRQDHLSTEENHSVFYKPNMAELYCQICVDWIGGIDANPAEQHYSEGIISKWLNALYETPMKQHVLKHKSIRQLERKVRWKDTPLSILKSEQPFCIISSTWMTAWELFVEGWVTENPVDEPIDQTRLRLALTRLNDNNSDERPVLDTIMIISHETWDYLSQHYQVKGSPITEELLMKEIEYKGAIESRIQRWKVRTLLASDCFSVSNNNTVM